MQPILQRSPNLTTGVAHLVGLACLIAILSFFYFVVHKPLATLQVETEIKVELIQIKLAEATNIRANHADTLEELTKLRAKVDVLNARVPTIPNESEFLGDISRLALDHGLRIDDFRRAPTTVEHDVPNIAVQVTGAANHRSLCEFLDAVDSLPRIALLTRLSVNPRPYEEDYPIQLNYALYYAPEEKPE